MQGTHNATQHNTPTPPPPLACVMFHLRAQKSVRLVEAKGFMKCGASVMPSHARAGLLTDHMSSSMAFHMNAMADRCSTTARSADRLWQQYSANAAHTAAFSARLAMRGRD